MNGASRSDREIALSAVRERSHSSPRHVLITGGAGFVGSNLAARLLSQGIPVTILDDLSRPGVEHNLAWLRDQGLEEAQVFTDPRAVAAKRVYPMFGAQVDEAPEYRAPEAA